MSVHRTKTGWVVRFREGGKNKSRSFDRRADAEYFDGEQRRIRQLGGVIPPRIGGVTLEDFAADWLNGKHSLSPRTRELYLQLLESQVIPYLGAFMLTDIRPSTMVEWQESRLAKGAGRTQVAKATTLLGGIFKAAMVQEQMLRNPVTALEPIRSKKRVPRPATPEQIEAMRVWFLTRERRADAVLISILAYGGLRPGEALALHFSDFDVDRLSITKALKLTRGETTVGGTKTERDRVAILPAPAARDLGEWKLATRTPFRLVWPRERDGQPWKLTDWSNWRRRWFVKAAEAAGLPDFRPYDLRHSCASLMIAENRPVTEVAAHLGHSPAMCLKTYSHMFEMQRGRPVRDTEDWIREARAGMREEATG